MRQTVSATSGATRARAVSAVSRTCACGTHTGGGPCDHCKGEEHSRAALIPTGGTPLAASLRERMESQFETRFDTVRLHRGAEADRSARRVNADAFTVGSDVVLSSRAQDPSSPAGEHLLAHELTHVAQQQFAPAPSTLVVTPSTSPLEYQAGASAANVVAGGGAGPIHAAPVQSIQRLETTTATASVPVEATMQPSASEEDLDPDKDVKLGVLDSPETDKWMIRVTGNPLGWELLREVIRGVVGATTQAQTSGRLPKASKRIMEMQTSPLEMGAMALGFLWGLVKGLLSPIVDLFHLVVGLVGGIYHGLRYLWEKATEIWDDPVWFITRSIVLAVRMDNLATKARETVINFLLHPVDGAKQLARIMDRVAEAGRKRARGLGRSAVNSYIDFIEQKPFEIGDKFGYALGFIVVQILLIVFSEGIGNALSALARSVAKGGKWIVSSATKVMRMMLGFVEELLGVVRALSNTVSKFFSGLLEELLGVFEALKDLLVVGASKAKGALVPAEGDLSAAMMSETKFKPKGTQTLPHKASDYTPPKVHPSKAGEIAEAKPIEPVKSAEPAKSATSKSKPAETAGQEQIPEKYRARTQTEYPPSAWNEIRDLEQRFPQLEQAQLRPIKRGSDQAKFYERMWTNQKGHSVQGQLADGTLVELDHIAPEGLVVDIKIRSAGEVRDPGFVTFGDQTFVKDTATFMKENIAKSTGQTASRDMAKEIAADIEEQLVKQAEFAETYKLKRGVEWRTNDPTYFRQVRDVITELHKHGIKNLSVKLIE